MEGKITKTKALNSFDQLVRATLVESGKLSYGFQKISVRFPARLITRNVMATEMPKAELRPSR